MQKPNRKLPLKQLVFDYNVNNRERNRYRLDIMKEQIVATGYVTDALVVEEQPDNKFLVLKGNRRGRACAEMVEDRQSIINILLAMAESETDSIKKKELKESVIKRAEQIVENISKLDCIVHKDLTPDERDDLVYDQGSILSLCRTEVVKSVWKLALSGKSEAEIIKKMYFSLANYTGNTKKLAEVESIKDDGEKVRAIIKWGHGTIGNQILAAQRMGEFVREQFILSRRQEDRLLEEGEKVEMYCSTGRISELSAAKNADSKDGGWTVEGGGARFNALIEKFKQEDAGSIEVEKKTRPSASELSKKADMYRSKALRAPLVYAAGEVNPLVQSMGDLDERCYRWEKVEELLVSKRESLPKEFSEFAGHVLHDVPGKLEAYLSELILAAQAK